MSALRGRDSGTEVCCACPRTPEAEAGLAPHALLEFAVLEKESGDCCDCPMLPADDGRVPLPPEVGRAPLPPEVGRGKFAGPPTPAPVPAEAVPDFAPQAPLLTGGEDAGGGFPQALLLVGGDLPTDPQLTLPLCNKSQRWIIKTKPTALNSDNNHYASVEYPLIRTGKKAGHLFYFIYINIYILTLFNFMIHHDV